MRIRRSSSPKQGSLTEIASNLGQALEVQGEVVKGASFGALVKHRPAKAAKEIDDLLREGNACPAIAERLGVCRLTVIRWVHLLRRKTHFKLAFPSKGGRRRKS